MTISHATPTFCDRISYLATNFLPNEVWIVKFCVDDVFAKNRKKHRNEGVSMSFEAF